ncbi:MAG: rRNA maturation RNase YbeY [Patescibacteria group bacterium]|jgi:probable rRNA maturation factor
MTNNLLNLNKAGEVADFSWLVNLENIFKKKFKLKKQISIALVSDQQIKELNRVYRKKNKITDVLSFNMDSAYVLGEVLICPSQARRQAKEKSHTYKAELQLLTIHGILHLLGYDHEKSITEEKKQQNAEQKILAQLNK